MDEKKEEFANETIPKMGDVAATPKQRKPRVSKSPVVADVTEEIPVTKENQETTISEEELLDYTGLLMDEATKKDNKKHNKTKKNKMKEKAKEKAKKAKAKEKAKSKAKKAKKAKKEKAKKAKVKAKAKEKKAKAKSKKAKKNKKNKNKKK